EGWAPPLAGPGLTAAVDPSGGLTVVETDAAGVVRVRGPAAATWAVVRESPVLERDAAGRPARARDGATEVHYTHDARGDLELPERRRGARHARRRRPRRARGPRATWRRRRAHDRARRERGAGAVRRHRRGRPPRRRRGRPVPRRRGARRPHRRPRRVPARAG